MAKYLSAVTGADLSPLLTILDTDGLPVNLAGSSIRFMVKAKQDDADGEVIVSAASPSTITIADAAAGQIRLAVPAATMASVAPGWYAWTVEVKTGAGAVLRYPDAYDGGPGKLQVTRSVIVAQPT